MSNAIHDIRPLSSLTPPLLPHVTLVESELLTLQHVTIAPSALARTAGDDSVETTGLELPLNGLLDLSARLSPTLLLLLHTLALLDLLLGGLGLPPASETRAVVCLVPLPERRGIDLDDGGSGQGVGSDKFVVGRVVGDGNDTDLAGDALRAPCEVTAVETKGAELAVSTARTDKMDTLAADTGVGRLAAFLECSALPLGGASDSGYGYYLPLLAVGRALSTSGAALVAGVTGDTEKC